MKIETAKAEDKIELLKAYAKYQSQVKDPVKNQNNPFTKSKYADLKSVEDAIKAGMEGTGLSFTQDFCENEDKRSLSVQTILIHEKGLITFNPLTVPIEKATAQGVGSAITYVRRYALTTNLGVAVEDDDGNSASGYSNSHSNYSHNNNYGNRNSYSNNRSNYQSKQSARSTQPAQPQPEKNKHVRLAVERIAQLKGISPQAELTEIKHTFSFKDYASLSKEDAEILYNSLVTEGTKLSEAINKKQMEEAK